MVEGGVLGGRRGPRWEEGSWVGGKVLGGRSGPTMGGGVLGRRRGPWWEEGSWVGEVGPQWKERYTYCSLCAGWEADI